MQWILRILVFALAAVAVTASGVAAAPTARGTLSPPRTVASWPFVAPYGTFAESMALGSDGYLYVSRTTWGEHTDFGAIVRVPVGGGATRSVVEHVNVAAGLFAGVAFDPQGRLYVALASFSDDVTTGVMRVEPNGTLVPVLVLPEGAFPNGLAFFDGYLYVTDPALGAIWRAPIGGAAVTQSTPWFQSDALAPGKTLGPDGIAFRGHTMYVTQYDRGQILAIDVGAGGTRSPTRVFAQGSSLKTSDGIAFDSSGNLWVTVNGNGTTDRGRIVVVSPTGSATTVAGDVPWLDYPTQPVFGGTTLYVANGSYGNGTPSVVVWR